MNELDEFEAIAKKAIAEVDQARKKFRWGWWHFKIRELCPEPQGARIESEVGDLEKRLNTVIATWDERF